MDIINEFAIGASWEKARQMEKVLTTLKDLGIDIGNCHVDSRGFLRIPLKEIQKVV